MSGPELPTARLTTSPQRSWVWVFPVLAALLVAILSWQAWGSSGPSIRIRFEQGHGLKAGDSLRHRGIVVGRVEEVALQSDLDGVLVTVRLDRDAAGLARAGSQFWIARPRIGWAGVTGLDTLIGARYVAVLPGGGSEQGQFIGMDEPPLGEALGPGLDVVLEARTRAGLVAGSPVTYRQIRVGTVLSAGLASDGRSVEVHLRVRRPFARLVRPETRFWATGGVGLDLSITGLELRLESLEALLVGGVALATPPGAGETVATGHRFVLHAEPEDDWLEWSPAVAIGHGLLPAGVPLPRPRRARLSWKEGRFFDTEGAREGWVLAVAGGLLGPADLLVAPPQAHEESGELAVAGERIPVASQAHLLGSDLALLPWTGAVDPWPAHRRRAPPVPEDCLLVADPNGSPLSVSSGRFTPESDSWELDPLFSLDPSWHGACAVSRQDGKVVGLLLVDEDRAWVVPMPDPLP